MSTEQDHTEDPAEASPPERTRRRRRPVLGAVSGLLFGVFLAVTLQQFAVRPLDNLSVVGLPVLGLLAGLALGSWAPLRPARSVSR